MKRKDFFRSLFVAPAAVMAVASIEEVKIVDPYSLGKTVVLRMGAIPEDMSFEEFMRVYKETGVMVIKEGLILEDEVKVVDLG